MESEGITYIAMAAAALAVTLMKVVHKILETMLHRSDNSMPPTPVVAAVPAATVAEPNGSHAELRRRDDQFREEARRELRDLRAEMQIAHREMAARLADIPAVQVEHRMRLDSLEQRVGTFEANTLESIRDLATVVREAMARRGEP